jgi:hypothetical protein
VSQLTLWEVDDLMNYWKDHPPVHVLAAAFLMGDKARRSKARPYHQLKNDANVSTELSFHDLAREIIHAGGTVLNKLPDIYR